jgi:hypothetical protein
MVTQTPHLCYYTTGWVEAYSGAVSDRNQVDQIARWSERSSESR